MRDSSCLDCCTCTNSGEMFQEDIDKMYREEETDDVEEEEDCSGSEP